MASIMPVSTREDALARRKKHRASGTTILDLLETTPARVAGPRAPAPPDEPLPDVDLGWRPNDLPRAIRSRRTYRIPVILLALVLAAGAYAGFRAALELPAAWARGQRNEYHAALDETAAALPGLRAAAAAVTDPAGDPGSAVVGLLRAEAAADGLQSAADSALPPDLPLLDDVERDLLIPLRDRMRSIADSASATAALLDDVGTYRGAAEDMFLLPDLPAEEEGPTVDLMAERLSATLTSAVTTAAQLPEVEMLAGHRAAVDEMIAWFPEWQSAYLHALRTDDLDAAALLRAEAETRIGGLRGDLDASLEVVRDQAGRAIELLERDLEVTMLLTG